MTKEKEPHAALSCFQAGLKPGRFVANLLASAVAGNFGFGEPRRFRLGIIVEIALTIAALAAEMTRYKRPAREAAINLYNPSPLAWEGNPMTESESRLFAVLRDRCYQKGSFTLSSGDKSDYYFDIKMIEMSSEGVALIGKVIYERTQALEVNAIGGLEIGAVPLTAAAVYEYHCQRRLMEGFVVRQEAKKHGTKKLIEGKLVSGSKVVIVDDVVTRGTSVLAAIQAVRKWECQPVLVLVLVDRLQGARKLIEEQGIRYEAVFTIGDFAKG